MKREEIETIIRDVGESTRYEDEIGGEKVNPILWHVIPGKAAEIIYKHHLQDLRERLEGLKEEIVKEINSRPQYPNIGKKGCVRRIDQELSKLKGE